MTPAERRERVAELSRAGLGPKKIAALLGVHRSSVLADRRVLGLAKPKPRISSAEVERARVLLQDGLSYAQVGAALGRTDKAIAHHLPGYMRRSAEVVARRRESVAAMTRAHRSVADMAAALGVTRAVVTRDRQVLGIAAFRAPRMTAAELERIHALLVDGASYGEVARTFGRDDRAIRARFPGFQLTPGQVAERARLGRAWAKLERA